VNIVKSGDTFQIYGDTIETFDTLPKGTYSINFNKFMGFFLSSHNALEAKEEKIYGCTTEKVNKILRSFSLMDRNMGVILSGPKGVGKSLFCRSLCEIAPCPVLLVDSYIPGIANFISSIDQEVVVFFDEFEKTFAATDDVTPQEEMLSLFDGVDSGKKLFIITCNEVDKLNNYLLNRPGRFHYHFSLTTPTGNEITEYMKDKLKTEYYNYIPQLVNLSYMGSMTYDCLRAVAFELNNGYTLEETLNDLNMSRDRSAQFDLYVRFPDGRQFCEYIYVDMLSNPARKNHGSWFSTSDTYHPNAPSFKCFFSLSDVDFSSVDRIKLPLEKVDFAWDNDDIECLPDDEKEYYKDLKPSEVYMTRTGRRDVYKYTV